MALRRAAVDEGQRRNSPTVVRWRFDRLVDAGYEPEAASKLAERLEVDLHEAVRLLHRGCPPATAVRILV